MKKSWQRFCAVVRKETIQLIRDKSTLTLMLCIPVMELFLLAYCAVFTAKNISMVVYDQSHDSESRSLINSFANSGYFQVTGSVMTEKDVISQLESGKSSIGLVIPPDLGSKVSRGEGSVSLVMDGADLYTLASSYLSAKSIIQNYSLGMVVKQVQNAGMTDSRLANLSELPITTSVQTLYNPNREDLQFIIPGIVAIILQMFAIVGVAANLVREREMGGAEQLLATPVRPIENILGKMTPYVVLCFLELFIIHFFGRFLFGVRFRGNFGLYLLLSFVFVVASLAVGMFISTIAQNQNQVMQITGLICLLSFNLSGLVFSRLPMPTWTKIIGGLLPMTHFVPIVRGLMIKGVGFAAVKKNVAMLGLFCVVLLGFLPFISHKRLD